MERPASIVNFERAYLARIVLGVIGAALTWNVVVEQASMNPAVERFGPGFVPTILGGGVVIGLAVSLLLWHFAARKASVVAKWIIVVFFALGLLSKVYSLASGAFPGGLTAIISAIDVLLGAAAVWFLFQPDARAWFGETTAA